LLWLGGETMTASAQEHIRRGQKEEPAGSPAAYPSDPTQRRTGHFVPLTSACRHRHQLVGDALGPRLDLLPVPEVPLREQRTPGRQTPDQPFRERELAGVQRTEEHATVTRLDGLL